MKKIKFITAAIGIIVLITCFQACKSEDSGNYQMDNQAFVNEAVSSNNFEITASTLVSTRSSNNLVKQYAAKMISEHTSARIDLSSIAAGQSLNVPTALPAQEQTNINALLLLTGPEFDAQYINMMIVSHQDAITLFQNASSNTGVSFGDLRNFATFKLPALNEHLQEAKSLQTQIQQSF
jgi:putative membrane protein